MRENISHKTTEVREEVREEADDSRAKIHNIESAKHSIKNEKVMDSSDKT